MSLLDVSNVRVGQEHVWLFLFFLGTLQPSRVQGSHVSAGSQLLVIIKHAYILMTTVQCRVLCNTGVTLLDAGLFIINVVVK